MIKNVYAPLSGGLVQERMMEIIANNLANTNTTAFKEDSLAFSAVEADPWRYATSAAPVPFHKDAMFFSPHGNEMFYVHLSEVKTSHEQQGPLQKTGRSTDLAIEGPGFFEVSTPFGNRYTRDGGFVLSPEGTLITKGGALVQGENGPITGLNKGSQSLEILDSGEVYLGGARIDKIKLVSFENNKALERVGDNLWLYNGQASGLQTSAQGVVMQGYLEGSNVNPVKNLTAMIVAHRTYEALQKTVKSQEETMQNANRLAEIS